VKGTLETIDGKRRVFRLKEYPVKNLIIYLAIASATFIAGSRVDFFLRSQEHRMLALISDFHHACVQKDTEYLGRILPADFTVTHFVGGPFGKDQFISNIASRPDSIVVESFYLGHPRVEMNANRATVTGESIDSARFPDNSLVEHSFDCILEFEKRDNDWQLVSIRVSNQ
jgi:hypothetical protein